MSDTTQPFIAHCFYPSTMCLSSSRVQCNGIVNLQKKENSPQWNSGTIAESLHRNDWPATAAIHANYDASEMSTVDSAAVAFKTAATAPTAPH